MVTNNQDKWFKILNWLTDKMITGKLYDLNEVQKTLIIEVFSEIGLPVKKTKGYSYYYELRNNNTTIVKRTFDYLGWVKGL